MDEKDHQHKTIEPQSDRKESGEQTWTHWHRKSLSEQDTDSTDTKGNTLREHMDS